MNVWIKQHSCREPHPSSTVLMTVIKVNASLLFIPSESIAIHVLVVWFFWNFHPFPWLPSVIFVESLLNCEGAVWTKNTEKVHFVEHDLFNVSRWLLSLWDCINVHHPSHNNMSPFGRQQPSSLRSPDKPLAQVRHHWQTLLDLKILRI